MDYTKLTNKIKEKFNCDVNFAIKMGFSERTLSLKLNNKSEFKQSEILKACKLLNISNKDINSYFFTPKVQKIEHIFDN